MSEIVGREVQRWSETLEELNEYDITLVNIIIKHYDDLIEAGGTASGKRANKLVEYVDEKKGVCDKMWTLHESYTKDHFAPLGARSSAFQKDHQFP